MSKKDGSNHRARYTLERSTLRYSAGLGEWSQQISLSSDMPRSVNVTAPHALCERLSGTAVFWL